MIVYEIPYEKDVEDNNLLDSRQTSLSLVSKDICQEGAR